MSAMIAGLDKFCAFCGADLSQKTGVVENEGKKFCSAEHQSKGQAKKPQGEVCEFC